MPVRVGRYTLTNRLVMAPMTAAERSLTARLEIWPPNTMGSAGVGLIVSEGTQPSDDGQGYLTTPGIYTPAHVEGWKRVDRRA